MAFWDALAPHLSMIENSYFDLPTLRRIVHEIHPPVLVVGAGQGLIVEDLQRRGLSCDGIDLSAEMIRYARSRRGLELIQADAGALPFGKASYGTVLISTGVVDFMSDETAIRRIMNEARRVAAPAASIFVAFYRLSAATEKFLTRLGLLRDNVLHHREVLEIYRLNPVQALAWAAKRAKAGRAHAAVLLLRSWGLSTWQEKRNAVRLQRILAEADRADTLLRAASQTQPYRNEAALRALFPRLAIPVRQFDTYSNCFLLRI